MELGNSLKIVSGVYVGILVPWSFLYLHDYVSERWNTIRRTEINGVIHLIVVLIPLPIILYYIYLQQALSDPDYKEMFAAIAAAVFSIYHFLRTIWGLYQLRQFRKWACATAVVMESASYECKLSPAAQLAAMRENNPLSEGSMGSQSTRFQTPSLFPRRNTRRLDSSPTPKPPGRVIDEQEAAFALETISSGSLQVDGEMLGQDSARRRCPKKCSTHDLWNTSPANSADGEVEYEAERDKRIWQNVNRMLVNSTIIDNEFIGSYAPWKIAKRGFRPLHRKAMFVRWVVVYLAHFGKEWMADCKAKDDFDSSWKGKRWMLAAKVWATAALRMETDCQTAANSGDTKQNVSTNVGGKSFLDPCLWSMVSSRTDDQIFDRERVLRLCFLSGDGLPYGRELLDDEKESLPSHSLYRPLIKEAIESLPTKFYEYIEDITPDHIEWFAAFVWVKRWGGCVPVPPNSSADGIKPPQPPSVAVVSKLSPQDVPVQVLRDQLGFDSSPKLEVCAFPILSSGYGRNLWGNRGVLQVSARIDNWVALCVGRQYAFLLKNEATLGPGGIDFEKAHSAVKSTESPRREESTSESSGTRTESESTERSQTISTYHKNLEIKRLRYQLANMNPQFDHLEHGLTFMGCIIESLRSGIAETLLTSYALDESRWRPPLPREKVTFPISEQLRLGLTSVVSIDLPGVFDSTMQERLLWECQNGVYWTWQNRLAHVSEGMPEPAPETAQAMMLCLLGFPSLQIQEKNPLRVSRTSRNGKQPPLHVQVWPVAGPQPFLLDVKVDILTSNVSIRISRGESATFEEENSTLNFHWQDWRDAIEGRMIGKNSWHKSHYMRDVQITRNDAKISTGIEPVIIGQDDGQSPVPTFRKGLVWKGWGPFRAGMSLFELRHSSLIIVGDSMPNDSASFDQEVTESTVGGLTAMLSGATRSSENVYPDAYDRASMAALTDASLFLNSLLTLNKALVRGADEVTQNMEEQQGLGTFVERISPQSSSSEEAHFKFQTPLLPREIIERAQEQDPSAMHVLAKWMLTGAKGIKKDYSKALLLLERSLILSHSMQTATVLIRNLLHNHDNPVDVERARAALELLWRDIAGRHEVPSIGKKRRWKGDKTVEEKRMASLVAMHLQLIDALPTAELMRTLADHLSTWGDTRHNEELATILYETAILAALDPKAMMELGRKFHRSNGQFAARMYIRALKLGQEAAARGLVQLIKSGGVRLSPADVMEIYTGAVRYGFRDALKEINSVLAGEGSGLADVARGRLIGGAET